VTQSHPVEGAGYTLMITMEAHLLAVGQAGPHGHGPLHRDLLRPIHAHAPDHLCTA